MNNQVASASPQTIGAIFTQFYIALEKCFEMKENDSVFIEYDGDISVLNLTENQNNVQIEVKDYSEALTDKHENFWNTLKNWLDKNFEHNKYNELLIITTQNIGPKSKFLTWDNSTKDERLKILSGIFSDAKEELTKRQEKENKKNKPKILDKPNSLKLMNFVFEDLNKTKLEEIIPKIRIISNHIKRKNIVEEICQRELKGLPDINRKKVLNELLGNLINSETYNIGWEISYNLFQNELQILTQRYSQDSKLFPSIDGYNKVSQEEKEETLKHKFVKKIEDIEYSEVITESIMEYLFTIKMISSELSQRKSSKESLNNFQDSLKQIHNPQYRKASRNCTKDNLLEKSKDFFDDIMGKESPNFDLFNDTPQIFKNGMYHILADDDNHQILWKLNPKKNNE